jgi:hypothetical protein
MTIEQYIGVIARHLLDDKCRDGKLEYIKEAREKYEVLEYHFEGDYPEKLLKNNHPSEELWMREYRRMRWQAPTKVATGRVYQFLQKIQQADDFKIRWEKDFQKTGIAEQVDNRNNTLPFYVSNGLPKYKSLETWIFNVFLKTYLKDSNAVCVVLPEFEEFVKYPKDVSDLNWAKPVPFIVCSDDLLYDCEDYVIWETEEWKDANQKKWKQYLALTTEGLMLFRQIAPFKEQSPFEVYTIPYSFIQLPAFKVGNVIYEEEDGHIIYDSVIEPCIPAWNEVLFRSDDLNVMYAVHALPQKWALKNSSCKTCNGTGHYINGKNERHNCKECNGSGNASATPFGLLEINIDKATAVNPNPVIPPIPPAGYIERPVNAVKLFQEDIQYKEFQGFKAIGLEILGQIPSNQSGIAKEYDRKELNTFCYSVCVHLADVYTQVCYHIMYQRYNSLFSSSLITDEKIQAALPKVTIPTNYDVMTAAAIGLMLTQARQNNYNPLIVHGIELDYVEKLYGENSEQKIYLKLINSLDPLAFKSTDEKSIILNTNGCTQLDFIVSSNIGTFIMQLAEQNPQWYLKPQAEQRSDLYALAAEKEKEIKAGIVPLIDNQQQPDVIVKSEQITQ